MIDSRKLEDLDDATEAKALEFLAACRAIGIPVLITSTYRDIEAQDALYAQGRSKPGRIVTRAAGGNSMHNYRCAFDFVPLVAGKPVWDNASLWARCGFAGESCGLEWGGRWSSMTDKPHMQNTGGRTLAQIKAGQA